MACCVHNRSFGWTPGTEGSLLPSSSRQQPQPSGDLLGGLNRPFMGQFLSRLCPGRVNELALCFILAEPFFPPFGAFCRDWIHSWSRAEWPHQSSRRLGQGNLALIQQEHGDPSRGRTRRPLLLLTKYLWNSRFHECFSREPELRLAIPVGFRMELSSLWPSGTNAR